MLSRIFHSLFYRSISELNGEMILKEKGLSNIKKATEILVIDDETFTYLENLQKYEFRIQQKKDLDLLTDAEAFDIILCDIRGVGKILESEFEGARLIKELKLKYSNKIIIAYTANDYSPQFKKCLDFADGVIPKGAALDDWEELLNQTLMQCVNPVSIWEKTRDALLRANVSTMDVAKYETLYVKAVKNGSFVSIKKMSEKGDSNASKIMTDLLGSLLVKVLMSQLG